MVCDCKMLAPTKSNHDCVEELKRSLATCKSTIEELKEERNELKTKLCQLEEEVESFK